MSGFENILRAFEKLEQDIEEAIADELTIQCDDVTEQLQATKAHGDVTGATRASYYALTATADDDGGDISGPARAAANEKNPGHASSETIPSPGPDAIKVVITSGTDYQNKLEEENAGKKAVVGPEGTRASPELFEAAQRGIRRVFRA